MFWFDQPISNSSPSISPRVRTGFPRFFASASKGLEVCEPLDVIADMVAVAEHAVLEGDHVHILQQPMGFQAAVGVGVHQDGNVGDGFPVTFPGFQPEGVPGFIGDGILLIQRFPFVGSAVAGGTFRTLHKDNAAPQAPAAKR